MTTPLAVNLAQTLPWAGIVIDIVSDPSKVKGAEDIILSHQRMLELADIVLCASVPVLNNAKQQLGESNIPKIRLFEDGFSTRLLDILQPESGEPEAPENSTGGPLAAYIGGINNKIWWDAVSEMAVKHPEICFAFVGPKEVSKIPCEGFGKNVKWYPAFKQYSQLGFFLGKCNIGLIPYVSTCYVSAMRPAKINEYLVKGLPIVATKMPELERLSLECGPGIIYLADNPSDFVSQLELALEEDCRELRKKRQQIAKQRSWDIICRELESILQTYK
jgi:glycosyltransferase involved in cell wall biosynthesis